MATLVGTQTLFVKALQELVELEYAAADAYSAAINRLSSIAYKQKLQSFKEDHERHIRQLSTVLQAHNAEVPDSSSIAKGLLTTGKAVLAGIIGDDAILSAMLSNELDTNTAYENMTNRTDQWEEIKEILEEAYADEKRHKAWLESPV